MIVSQKITSSKLLPTVGLACRMSYAGGNTTLTYNVITVMPLDTVDEDNYGMADVANNRFILPWGGRWIFTAGNNLHTTGDYVRSTWFYRNGSDWSGDQHDYTGGTDGKRFYRYDSVTSSLDAGDAIDFRCRKDVNASSVGHTSGCDLYAYYVPGIWS